MHGASFRARLNRSAMLFAGLCLLLSCVFSSGHPVTNASTITPGNAMLNWAETQTGKPYEWGGTGPWGYDCSGLVYAAARHIGITLPRTTYSMIYSWHLVRVYNPQRGDLAFFGPVGAPYHVEFVTVWHDTTFGAHDFGTLLGWARYWPPFWAPSAFYRIR